MRDVIWKFPLQLRTGWQSVEMPHDCVTRRFSMQNGVPCLWVEVRSGASKTVNRFAIVGTGHQLPDDPARRYVGSCDDGAFVWHLYQGLLPIAESHTEGKTP
jgi:hypothetical protein